MRIAYSGPSSASSRSASHAATAGLAPPVETVTSSGSLNITAGSVKLQFSGSSALLTHTPAVLPVQAHLPVHLGVVRGGDHQPVPLHLAPGVGALLPCQRVEGRDRWPDLAGDDVHLRPAGHQTVDLAGRHLPAAHDQAALALDIEVHRVGTTRRRHQGLAFPASLPAPSEKAATALSVSPSRCRW